LEFCGGPKIEPKFGRLDHPDGKYCPPNGRLPDATKGAEHLREVFGRMGFNDQEIVALSGAHTLGSCHLVRSGFDGPWTRNPLKFDNAFFKNLMFMDWKPRQWDGPLQYEDVLTGELMMLPTDLCLKTDPQFRVWAEKYANDEQLFFNDFAAAFSKLLHLGAPSHPAPVLTEVDQASLDLMAAAMHGNLSVVQKLAPKANVHATEKSSGRNALHKASFWGHHATVSYLINEAKLNVNAVDFNGDTALHDAVRFGHQNVVDILLAAKSDLTIKNRDGDTPLDVGVKYRQNEKLLACLKSGTPSGSKL